MWNTRRGFIQSGAMLAGLSAGASAAQEQAAGGALTPAADIQVPKMKFFHAEISRMVLGVNPFYGFAHYNSNFGNSMKEFYTADRVCAVMHQAARFGINVFASTLHRRLRGRRTGRASWPKAGGCT